MPLTPGVESHLFFNDRKSSFKVNSNVLCPVTETRPTGKHTQGVCMDNIHKHVACQGHTLVKGAPHNLPFSWLQNKFHNVQQLHLVKEKIETDT